MRDYWSGRRDLNPRPALFSL